MKRTILPPSMMITSIIGFIISAIYTASGTFERYFLTWCRPEQTICDNLGTSLGFAFCFTFVIMFIASMISITPTDEELKKLH